MSPLKVVEVVIFLHDHPSVLSTPVAQPVGEASSSEGRLIACHLVKRNGFGGGQGAIHEVIGPLSNHFDSHGYIYGLVGPVSRSSCQDPDVLVVFVLKNVQPNSN